MIQLENIRVAVLGAGVEGQSARAYLIKHGALVEVFEDVDDAVDLGDYAMLIRSPGIRPDHPQILKAEKLGAVVSSTSKLFFEQSPTKHIIGVTGTKGKGTTSTLIYEILRAAGLHVYLGGNIGTPPLDFLDELGPDSWVVLEMSSFQLMDLTVSPHIAVILMVTSEHMDWHLSLDEYLQAKTAIVRFQSSDDFFVVNREYPNSLQIVKDAQAKRFDVSIHDAVSQGAYVKDGQVVWADNEALSAVVAVSEIRLPGRHNWENVCAAVAAAKCAGVEDGPIRQAVSTFPGLEHRIELVRQVGGVRYYNDSFSTVPETTIAAIRAFDEPKVLILGGSSKQSDFSQLAKTIKESGSIRAIVGIGVEWQRIKEQLSALNYQPPTPYVESATNMGEIVQAAHDVSHAGDVVLLSPACASFGMFKNYKDRGKQYKELVMKL